MIRLPNGCNCSEPKVLPKNWKSGGASLMKKQWMIYYYFRDPKYKHIKKYKYGMLVRKKGMNESEYQTLEQRREITKDLIDDELKLLQSGYNPIENEMTVIIPVHQDTSDILPTENWITAIKKVSDNLKVVDSTKAVLKSVLNNINGAATDLQYDALPLSQLRVKHIKVLLSYLQKKKGEQKWGPASYNMHLAYLHRFFEELLLFEAVDLNPAAPIPKQEETPAKREVLTTREQNAINKDLKVDNYQFWRYVMIFFYSGARSTELLRLQVKDVNLKEQWCWIEVFKGKKKKTRKAVIMDNVIHLWRELLKGADPEHYVFSVGLEPGPKQIRIEQIKRRWNTHVKIKLKINKTMYPLKHLMADLLAKKLDIKHAAKLDGHTSSKITKDRYAYGEEERARNRIKKTPIKFGT
jgi:integrase